MCEGTQCVRHPVFDSRGRALFAGEWTLAGVEVFLQLVFHLQVGFRRWTRASKADSVSSTGMCGKAKGSKEINHNNVTTIGGCTCSAQRRPLRTLGGRLERRRHQRGGRQAGIWAQFSARRHGASGQGQRVFGATQGRKLNGRNSK